MSEPISALAISMAICLSAFLPAVLSRLPIPGVVYEIALGVVIGPQVLGLNHAGPVVSNLAEIGLGILFLMAGFEVEPGILRGAPMSRALVGWLLGLILAYLLVGLATMTGLIGGPLLTAVAMTTTAVGTLFPVLRDQGWLKSRYGPYILAAGATGEAAPLVAVALILAGSQAGWEAGILVLFGLSAAVAVALAGRTSTGPFARLVESTMEKSGQLPVRLAICLMIALIVLSRELDIDLVLGAFAAGAVLRAAMPHHLHKSLLMRLDGLGYGFLIPIFFVVSGMRLDVLTLVHDPKTLLLVPLFVLIMLAARGLPAMLLYKRELELPQRKALALHCSTELPLVVAISSIGVSNGSISSAQGAAMVGAGILTLILFPGLAARYGPE